MMYRVHFWLILCGIAFGNFQAAAESWPLLTRSGDKEAIGLMINSENSRSIQVGSHFYTRHFSDPLKGEKLYEVNRDPFMLTNLLKEPNRNLDDETKEIRRKLSDQLTEALRKSGDAYFVKPDHATFLLHGWTIHLHDHLWSMEGAATRQMLELMDEQLGKVVAVVPPEALSKIKEIPIWINSAYPGKRGGAEYHPGRQWLENNGRNPEMTRAVEITNTHIFPFENRRMPYLMLHELAHGYHHRYLEGGYGNKELRDLFEQTSKSGSYNEVDRFDGRKIKKDKAYAMTNPMEYFAESSEAFFGKNDFFPFNRKELKQHDPAMFQLLAKLWGAEVVE